MSDTITRTIADWAASVDYDDRIRLALSRIPEYDDVRELMAELVVTAG